MPWNQISEVAQAFDIRGLAATFHVSISTVSGILRKGQVKILGAYFGEKRDGWESASERVRENPHSGPEAVRDHEQAQDGGRGFDAVQNGVH